MAKNPYQGDDVDYFEAARDKEGGVKQTGLAPSAKLSNFGAAFNAARKAGDKTFTFKGKQYTTEMAKPKAKPAEKGPDKATLDRIPRNLKDADKGPDKDALDRGAAAVKKIEADEAAAKNKPADKKPSDRPGSKVLAEKMEKGQPKMRAAYEDAFGNIKKALGFKSGGKVESKLMGKEGRGMAKATMQKVASKAVKGHESRMHKMKSGGSVSARADGIALRGKTRGKMV